MSDMHTTEAPPQNRIWEPEMRIENWQPVAGRLPEVARGTGPADTALRRREISLRPFAVYAGDLDNSETHIIGLGSPPVQGSLIRRVTMKVRTTHALGAAYWTIGVYWINLAGDSALIGEVTTENFSITANVAFEIWSANDGVRLEPNHELVAQFAPTGSAVTLKQVAVYPEWYVGL